MKGGVRGRALLVGVLVALVAVLAAIPASAQPTEEEVGAAIAAGVAWLAAQQESDGSWGSWEECAVTAFAVKKLEHHAVDAKWGLGLPSPFDDGYPYKDHVVKGLEWIFAHCPNMVGISLQPAGDPDSDGDGIGVWFGTSWWHSSYTTGIALMMMCEAVELDRTVDIGPLAGWTYEDVARDMMDWLAYGQNEAGTRRGGWGYYANQQGWSGNSNSGYVALGLGFAEAAPPEGCGFTIPQFVKDELNIWIDYIQNDVDGDMNDGGSGYTHPNSWVNILKTGNLLQQMALVGDDETTPRVQDALDYMARHWYVANWDPGWRGAANQPSNYQATFTSMKGFTSLGIHEFGDPPIDWQTEFETQLLAEQNPDGSWPRTMWDPTFDAALSTIWALLTLQKIAPPREIEVPVDIKPQSCPNPLNVGSKGVLPVAILGTDDFDVTQVDVSTIQLEGVSPLRWEYEDVATPYEPYTGKESSDDCTIEGPDLYMDLTLKFDLQEIVAALGDVEDGDVLVLQLTGNLLPDFGGTPIVGEDVVVILKKGKG